MSLPTVKKEAYVGFPDQASWLIFSAPKVGKTMLASKWPECLILECELHGDRYIEGAYVEHINSLDELRSVTGELLALSKKGKLIYQTIALDTIDTVNEWVEQEVCSELGIAQMGEAGYGLDWGKSREQTRNVVKILASLPVNLLILAHSRWAIVNEVNVGHTIDLPGKLARFTMADIENIIFISISKDGTRKLIPQPVQGIEAGSRNPILNATKECECSYRALRALFDEKPKEEAVGEGKLIANGVLVSTGLNKTKEEEK